MKTGTILVAAVFFLALGILGEPGHAARTIDAEEEFWREVKDSKVADELEDYLKEFPSGRFARLARLKIRRLKRKAAPKPTPVVPKPTPAAPKQAAIRTKSASGTWSDPVTGMEFVLVPGGSFEMGCHANAGKCDSDEKPVRTVRLDGFWMGKHEVTQGQWQKVMGHNPSRFKQGDNYPVERVSWHDVQNYIRELNAQSSATFRLPSEAEWEYACRAGGKAFKYGTLDGQISSRTVKHGGGGTTSVGRYPANGLGLHDMSGNVWEWVQDKKANYRNVGTDNPIYESSGATRVFRGGSWSDSPRRLRCSVRVNFAPLLRGRRLGFRLLRTK